MYVQINKLLCKVLFNSVGSKSTDKDSPAYVPTLFSFSGSPAKHKGEKDLQRWESAKRRRINNNIVLSTSSDEETQEDTAIDAMVIAGSQTSLSVQNPQTIVL